MAQFADSIGVSCRGSRMQILNAAICQQLATGNAFKLNLGSGERQIPGYFNLDCTTATKPDILADLNEPLNLLPDGGVDAVYARHTLEHVENLIGLLSELHRICRSGATLEIIVPHFSNS